MPALPGLRDPSSCIRALALCSSFPFDCAIGQQRETLLCQARADRNAQQEDDFHPTYAACRPERLLLVWRLSGCAAFPARRFSWQLNRDLANQETYYWNQRSSAISIGHDSMLLLSVYQLHNRKGCKPRARSNYLSIDAIHIEATRAAPTTNLSTQDLQANLGDITSAQSNSTRNAWLSVESAFGQ